jgi:ferredoxin
MTSYISEIDENKCVGCGICIDKCPIEAVSLIDGKAYDDKHKCIGCGVCVHHCPENARTLKQTELREIYLPPLVIKN